MSRAPKRKAWSLQPNDLINTARLLAGHGRKPSQANLRRAISSAYYALFHSLARASADSLVGGYGANRSDSAWRQVYRALEHGAARNACRNKHVIERFPQTIQNFADTFVTIQDKRYSADYDPFMDKFTKTDVLDDIAKTESTIEDFRTVPLREKRAFCAHILFKHRL